MLTRDWKIRRAMIAAQHLFPDPEDDDTPDSKGGLAPANCWPKR